MNAALEHAEHVQSIDGFASAVECDAIVSELDSALWKPSRSYRHEADDTYTTVAADDRVSETAHQEFFSETLGGLLAAVERRLAGLVGVDTCRLEWWQATRFPVGGRLDYHLDSGYWAGHYAGDRVRTFLLYLSTPAAGGGTHFRALDVLVEARAGRLAVWDDLLPDGRPDHSMIHAGMPVLAGEKITLVTWERQRRFRE